MSRLLLLSALLLAAPGCVHRLECTAHDGTTFREAETPHFRIRSDLPEDELRSTARRLEDYVAALALVHGADLDSSQKLEVIALGSLYEIGEFSDIAEGYTVPGSLIVFPADESDDRRSPGERLGGWRAGSVITHELAHHVHSYVLLRQATWITEGLATYEETVALDPTGTVAHFGGESSLRLAHIREDGVEPLEALWAWADGDEHLVARLYASAWIWTHYLFDERRPDFEKFLARLRKAEDPREAFRAVFGSDDAKLKEAVEKYVAAKTYLVFDYRVPPHEASVSIRELPPAQVHVARAELASTAPSKQSSQERREATRRELKLAMELGGNDPRVRLGVARMLETPAERLKEAQKLVELAPDMAGAWALLAAESAYPRQLEALKRAVALEPKHAEALNALARTLVTRRDDPVEAQEYAERAVKAMPWNPKFVDTLAAALALQGKCRAAYDTELRAIDLLSEKARPSLRKELKKRAAGYGKERCDDAVPRANF